MVGYAAWQQDWGTLLINGNIAYRDTINTAAWCTVVLLTIQHLQVEQAALLYTLNTYIIKGYVFDMIPVAAVDGDKT